MNSKISKTSELYRLLLILSDKINLKRGDKYIDLRILYMEKYKKSHTKSNTFKISALTCNDKFDLPGRSYSVSHIQDYFEYFIKKYETGTDNPPIRIYINKIENRITFKIKTGRNLEFVTPEMINCIKNIEPAQFRVRNKIKTNLCCF